MANRLVEHLFFFGLLGFALYLMWSIFVPFLSALSLAAIISTVCYPGYRRILAVTPKKQKSVASLLAVLAVILIVFVPLFLLGYLLFIEAASFYGEIESGTTLSGGQALADIENVIQQFFPSFALDISAYAGQAAGWVASNIGAIFAGTASTVFLFFVTLIAMFYMFRDGEVFTKHLVSLSPLPDSQDTHILAKLARSVRSVVLGTLTVAIIQGTLTAIGFAIFGIEHAILWGSVAAIGALIPGIGTTIVFAPTIIILLLAGSYGSALGITIWGLFAVGVIDNLLGPYLMSRGATLHPFFVLLSVLGGISLFGPIGLVVGPVTLSLLMVLLELYRTHISPDSK